nr:hypothetical protein [Gemmatimonadales bacterium]
MNPEWRIHCSTGNNVTLRDGSAEISADWNTYAHISRPLGTDNVTVSARIRPSSPTGITWCTSVFLLWDGGDWCQMGVISAPDGGRYYAVETRDGTTSETYLDECDLTTWRYVRIQLGRDCVRYLAGDDGEHWRCLRVIERPTEFPGPPAFLVAGKGYGRGTAPYANPELDNDYHDRGEKVVSAIADIRAETTPSDRRLLTAAERSQLREADLDPVGKVELRGEADPSFERVAKYYPAMRFPREAVGVPEHPDDIGVDYLGRLQLSGDITSAKSPTAWLEIGDPPIPLASDEQPLERKLLRGCLPIVVITAKHEHMECEQTVFGWSEGFSPEADLFAYVRLKVRVPKGQVCPTAAHLVLGPENKRTSWPLQERRSDEAEICLRIPFRDPAGAS